VWCALDISDRIAPPSFRILPRNAASHGFGSQRAFTAGGRSAIMAETRLIDGRRS
jgi:hypothetical protein